MTYDTVIIICAMLIGACFGLCISTFIAVGRLESSTEYTRGYTNGLSDARDIKRMMERYRNEGLL